MPSGSAICKKPREKLTDNERACVDGLVLNGFDVVVRAEDPEAPANIDLEIDGELWEMKNVTNVTSSVGNQMARVRRKWWKLELPDPVRAVFTTEGATDSFEEIIDELASWKHDNEQFIVLSKTGELRRL